MRILNLYAGIGGNRKLWGDEHEITAVEYKQDIADVYKQLFPNDTVIVADAHQYLLDHYKEFDFIWSSPPCPTHSRMQSMQKIKSYPDMQLWQEIIFLTHRRKHDPWVVENVIPYYKPFVKPATTIARHHFWSNKLLDEYEYDTPFHMLKSTTGAMEKTYDIKLPPTPNLSGYERRKLLRNAVIPEVGLHILNQINK